MFSKRRRHELNQYLLHDKLLVSTKSDLKEVITDYHCFYILFMTFLRSELSSILFVYAGISTEKT
jgi:hypothetical protein